MAKGRFNGAGMPGNMNNMMKQIQKMQREMTETQEQLEQKVYEASAGGGAVKAVVTGEKRLSEITIAPEAVDPDDVEMLEDLILTAVNDVIKQVDNASASKMSSITGGLNIPGMF